MRRSARRASLVVVLLLTSVGAASAECAWVLWGLKSNTWIPLTAFDSRAECESLRKTKAPTRKTDGLYVTCFPDTVDPRGPKGK
jgi:hypothetical protein